MPPASLLTHKQRQRDRLYGAVDNLWYRDNGAHRRDLRALLALVDAEQITIAEATKRVTDIDRRTTRHFAAA